MRFCLVRKRRIRRRRRRWGRREETEIRRGRRRMKGTNDSNMRTHIHTNKCA